MDQLSPVRLHGGWHIETHVGGRRVATLSEFPNEAEAREWAYLLSAAPQLLAALEAIVEHEQMDGTGIRYSFDYNSTLGLQARAVIAKAKGA